MRIYRFKILTLHPVMNQISFSVFLRTDLAIFVTTSHRFPDGFVSTFLVQISDRNGEIRFLLVILLRFLFGHLL